MQGLRRGPPGTYYIYNEDLLDVVRDAYPSSEDVNWMLTNQDNRPTKEVGVEDLFQIIIQSLEDMLQRPGFIESYEEWRQRDRSEGKYTDVYDGQPFVAELQSLGEGVFLKDIDHAHDRNSTAPLYKVDDFFVVPGADGEGTVPWFAKVIATQPSGSQQTTEVTRKKIKDSRGGVLLIDEAYRLAQADSSSKDVGKEALELMNVMEGGDLVMISAGYPDEMASFLDDTVQDPVALGEPHLGVLIYPGQLIDAELVRDARTLAMAAPVPVLRGDVTLVGCSLMEIWKKEDEDAAAEREEYREEWAMFDEDMAYLAHLERIMDAEDSSEDEVEEARRLYDQHVQVMNHLESSVVSRDELQTSAELIVSQDRCFASTHVLHVEESLDRTNIVVRVKASDFSCLDWIVSGFTMDLIDSVVEHCPYIFNADYVYDHIDAVCTRDQVRIIADIVLKVFDGNLDVDSMIEFIQQEFVTGTHVSMVQEQEDPDIVPTCSSSSSDDSIDEDDDGGSEYIVYIINVGHSGEVRVDALLGRQLTESRSTHYQAESSIRQMQRSGWRVEKLWRWTLTRITQTWELEDMLDIKAFLGDTNSETAWSVERTERNPEVDHCGPEPSYFHVGGVPAIFLYVVTLVLIWEELFKKSVSCSAVVEYGTTVAPIQAVLRSMEEDVHEQVSCWQEGGQASPEPDCPQHPSASVVRRGQAIKSCRMKAMEQRQPRRKYSRKPGTNMCSICGKPKLNENDDNDYAAMHGIGKREKRPWGQNRRQENVNSDSSDTGFSDSESDMSGCMGHQPKENPTAMKDTGVPFRLMEGTGDDGKGSIRTGTQLNATTSVKFVPGPCTPEAPQATTSVKFVPGPRTPNREPDIESAPMLNFNREIKSTKQALEGAERASGGATYYIKGPRKTPKGSCPNISLKGCEHLHELNKRCKFSLLVVPRASIKYYKSLYNSDYLQDDSMTRQALEVIVQNMITVQCERRFHQQLHGQYEDGGSISRDRGLFNSTAVELTTFGVEIHGRGGLSQNARGADKAVDFTNKSDSEPEETQRVESSSTRLVLPLPDVRWNQLNNEQMRELIPCYTKLLTGRGEWQRILQTVVKCAIAETGFHPNTYYKGGHPRRTNIDPNQQCPTQAPDSSDDNFSSSSDDDSTSSSDDDSRSSDDDVTIDGPQTHQRHRQ
ncbi:hypothetical protein Bbelb_318080 [Branchiostoma belcheri]|nr:hypothetical protein Bbelb_318080 [Branchiostoma belcheri]